MKEINNRCIRVIYYFINMNIYCINNKFVYFYFLLVYVYV